MKSIVRAWKDPIFRSTLTAAEQSVLAHPAGMIELTGTDLDAVAGGGKKGCGSGGSGSSGKSSKSRGSGKSKGSSGSGKSGKSGRSCKC